MAGAEPAAGVGGVLARAFTPPDLEIRSDGTGRTVHGIVVPWDQVATVSDGGRPYKEAWQRGAFAGTNPARVKLLSQHEKRSNPIGRGMALRDDASGLYGEFKVSKTRAGDEVLELINDGALDAFSVGFRAGEHQNRSGVVWRTRAALDEVSVVTFPAYSGAVIQGVRSQASILHRLTPQELAVLRRVLL